MSHVLLLLGLIGSTPAKAEEVSGVRQYTLAPEKSVLAVLVRYDRSALIPGHDHVAQAKTFTGTVTWDDAEVSRCQVNVQFPVRALQIDPPGSRERFGLEGKTNASTVQKIEANMFGLRVLNAASFGEITFTSTECKSLGSQVSVVGTLSIRGVGVEVGARMNIKASAESFSAEGRFEATHDLFGMKPYTAALGAVKNDNTLVFLVNVYGTPK